MTESTMPPPASGGGMRYALIGLLLLLGAVGLYCATQEDEPEPVAQQTQPDAGPPAPPPRQIEPTFEIPEEVEDAGVDTAPPPETMMASMSGMRRRECTGDINVAGIRAVVSRARPQVRACYERRLKVNNILQGNVQVRMIVGRDGSVDQVAVGGTLRDSEVFSCVRRLANTWRFPNPTGGCAQVNVPFSLSPRP
ncbi:MAG: AgmX/PglI C-terminal domain-containing protein [Myxococcota bacterium]